MVNCFKSIKSLELAIIIWICWLTFSNRIWKNLSKQDISSKRILDLKMVKMKHLKPKKDIDRAKLLKFTNRKKDSKIPIIIVTVPYKNQQKT